MVTASNLGSGKKVNVGQSFANGMSALQTVKKEKFVIVDESGTNKDAERISLFKMKDSNKTYIVYTFNEVDEMSQKYSESVEALGRSIEYPLSGIFSGLGLIVGSKYLMNASKNASPASLTKYLGIFKSFNSL